MSLRIYTFLLIVLTSFGCYEAFSAEPGKSYDAYTKEAESYCDDSSKSWSTNNTLVPKIDYPELSSKSVNATLAKWRDNNPRWMVGDEKARLRADLDPNNIGEFTWFKALEVARIGYRSNMNALFACAVVTSRIETIVTLQELISKKIKTKNSEILEKLKKEWNKLEQTSNKLKCNPSKDKEEMMIGLINTATHQYCHYRHYLDYLDSSLTAGFRDVQEIDRDIGQWTGNEIAGTTYEWTRISWRYMSDLSNEIIRADSTLPHAIASLTEMDRTYGVHIMLTFIYDDYIRLREALSYYMNLNSQLYQKANNAQNANKS